MNELALFAGAGGGILGSTLLGWRTVCAVEINAFCARRLIQRQNEGHLPPFPVWDDVRTFDGRPWHGLVDVVSGGFPCQDIAAPGCGLGLDGSRSGLWSEYARILKEVHPRCVFIENSPILRTRGLVRVLKDLAALGYNASWGVFSACSLGFSHSRERMFIVANANGHNGKARLGDGGRIEWDGQTSIFGGGSNEHSNRYFSVRLEAASLGVGVADGVAHRVDRVRAIGNGQVPAVAATAWCLLTKDAK